MGSDERGFVAVKPGRNPCVCTFSPCVCVQKRLCVSCVPPQQQIPCCRRIPGGRKEVGRSVFAYRYCTCDGGRFTCAPIIRANSTSLPVCYVPSSRGPGSYNNRYMHEISPWRKFLKYCCRHFVWFSSSGVFFFFFCSTVVPENPTCPHAVVHPCLLPSGVPLLFCLSLCVYVCVCLVASTTLTG